MQKIIPDTSNNYQPQIYEVSEKISSAVRVAKIRQTKK